MAERKKKTKKCDACYGKGFYTQMRAGKIYKEPCGKCGGKNK